MKRIVVAIDSFKGCMSAVDLTEAITKGIRKAVPDCEVCKIPMADGGEGTVDVLTEVLGGTKIHCVVDGPLRNPVKASYGWIDSQKLAIIEMASASGLPLIPFAEGNVMRTTTYGTGQLIKDALLKGCRRILLGIGGSATNDAGLGMLQALGFRFLDAEGRVVPDGGACLIHISKVDDSQVMPQLKDCRIEVATDVNHVFYGEQGAACVFAPQKGATPQQVRLLDEGLQSFAKVIWHYSGIDVQKLSGSGAAGGLGGGCAAFLNARLSSGIGLIKDILQFDTRIENADLIITGEGKVDSQTSGGKVVSGIIDSAHKYQIPVIVLAGNCVEMNPLLELDPLVSLFSIHSSPVTLREALDPEYTARQIERMAYMLIKLVYCK